MRRFNLHLDLNIDEIRRRLVSVGCMLCQLEERRYWRENWSDLFRRQNSFKQININTCVVFLSIRVVASVSWQENRFAKKTYENSTNINSRREIDFLSRCLFVLYRTFLLKLTVFIKDCIAWGRGELNFLGTEWGRWKTCEFLFFVQSYLNDLIVLCVFFLSSFFLLSKT